MVVFFLFLKQKMNIYDYRAEDLDKLIKYALSARKSSVIDYIIPMKLLSEKVLENATPEEINLMLSTISNYNPTLLTQSGALNNINTLHRWLPGPFLNEFYNIRGGFKKLFSDDFVEKQKKEKERMLNLEKLQYDIKNSKSIYNTYWWTFGISIAGFLLALSKILYDAYTKK
ncbi:MAG: hypothetical protein ACR2FN_01250 [Chitinophagaceae bacterium]